MFRTPRPEREDRGCYSSRNGVPVRLRIAPEKRDYRFRSGIVTGCHVVLLSC